MKFLLDQDVYEATARFLIGLRHDVVRAAQIGLAQAEDEVLLRTAQQQGRLFVTRDRDFGSLVFVRALGAGVLYLRSLAKAHNAVHGELARVLNTYSQDELTRAFVVIEADGHRFRKIPDE